MTQLSSFQSLPSPPGPASATSTQLTPFSSPGIPTIGRHDSILSFLVSCSRLPPPSGHRPVPPTSIRSVPLPLTAYPLAALPHQCDPNSLGVLTTRLSPPLPIPPPRRGSVRGPIPTRRRATAKTSVQSPLWKKNTYTSLAPVLFLLFPSPSSSSESLSLVVHLFLLVFVLALPLFLSLP